MTISKKGEINYLRVFLISIAMTIIIDLIVSITIISIDNAHRSGCAVFEETPQQFNQPFEAYFGDKKYTSEVKQLMALIRSSNINSDDNKLVFVNFNGAYMEPSEVSKNLQNIRTYMVGLANNDIYDIDNSIDNDKIKNDAAYYNGGYIRIITIIENPLFN